MAIERLRVFTQPRPISNISNPQTKNLPYGRQCSGTSTKPPDQTGLTRLTYIKAGDAPEVHQEKIRMEDPIMKLSVSVALAALTTIGIMGASTEKASAVVYCTYVGYPANCVVRPGVVLRPRPVARQAVVGAGTVNRGGPVNRAGRR